MVSPIQAFPDTVQNMEALHRKTQALQKRCAPIHRNAPLFSQSVFPQCPSVFFRADAEFFLEDLGKGQLILIPHLT